jgi:hypothetical protein
MKVAQLLIRRFILQEVICEAINGEVGSIGIYFLSPANCKQSSTGQASANQRGLRQGRAISAVECDQVGLQP